MNVTLHFEAGLLGGKECTAYVLHHLCIAVYFLLNSQDNYRTEFSILFNFGSLIAGVPQLEPVAYRSTVDGQPYLFQLYPEITSISPSTGSMAGTLILLCCSWPPEHWRCS